MINETRIKGQIESLIDNNSLKDPEASKEYFAKGLAEIIADAIKSATITVSSGITVQTIPSTGTGTTTSTGSCVIS